MPALSGSINTKHKQHFLARNRTMAKTEQKVYMPLMIGDWLKGTRGMKAEVRGVYINLLLYQWDNGYIPSDMETLSLIDPEVGKVWVFIKDKFQEFEPGKLRNLKNDEVKEFWKKQGKNGKKGGRPKKENPNDNPNNIPNDNLHNDIDLDNDLDLKKESVEEKLLRLDEIYIASTRMKWTNIDFDKELQSFRDKVRGSPEHYADHSDLRLAFQAQLRNAKPIPKHGKHSEITVDERNAFIRKRAGLV